MLTVNCENCVQLNGERDELHCGTYWGICFVSNQRDDMGTLEYRPGSPCVIWVITVLMVDCWVKMLYTRMWNLQERAAEQYLLEQSVGHVFCSFHHITNHAPRAPLFSSSWAGRVSCSVFQRWAYVSLSRMWRCDFTAPCANCADKIIFVRWLVMTLEIRINKEGHALLCGSVVANGPSDSFPSPITG